MRSPCPATRTWTSCSGASNCGTLRALIERAGKPAPEALAADRPVFLMAIHVEAGITNVIAVVKQLYNRRQPMAACIASELGDVGLLLFQCDERLGLFSLFLWRRCCRWFPDRSVFALFNQSCATGIALKPVRHIAFWRQARQTDDAHTCSNRIKGPCNPLHTLATLFVIILMDVDMPIAKVFIEIVRPVARAPAIGGAHE